MKTSARTMILASLVGAACSGGTGDGGPGPSATAPLNPPGAPSATQPPGGSVAPPGDPGTSPPGDPGTTPPGDTPPSTDTGTTSPPTDGATEPPPPPDTGECQPGVPVTSQIPRLSNAQYDMAVRDLFNVAPPSGDSWSATFEPDSNGELPSTQWAQYRSTAEQIAVAVMDTPLGSELATAAADPPTLEASIRSLGRKVFRRPMTDDEVASFMTLADVEPAGTPDEIAEMVVYSMLISPSFLMRTELDTTEVMVPGTQQTAYQLSDYEVASRLSFLIWNSVPDEELNAAADAGELQTNEQIRAQAERMLGEEFRDKITPVIVEAHKLWANIDETSSNSRWGKTPHDASIFPEYSEAQNEPLMAEVEQFFAEVGYDGQFQDLFLSNVAYVNQDTAALYDLDPSSFGPELERVELDGMERPGFLTRGAFLSSFAHERDTSPILRGVFILTLMGGRTGPPSPAAETTELPPGDYQTNREAVTAWTSVSPECISCHENVINPPGFVLENFSAVGSIQTTDPTYGGPIDTSVPSVAFPAGPKPIDNAYELMTEIAAGRLTKEIYADKWVRYATGREANDFDRCTVNAIADKLEAGGYTLANILADITQADSFRLRAAAE